MIIFYIDDTFLQPSKNQINAHDQVLKGLNGFDNEYIDLPVIVGSNS
ncbi:hypothetical protein [Candidatus Nitrosocosmicus sp. T]